MNGLAYLGNLILDVTDPTSPTLVSWFRVGVGYMHDIHVTGGLAYCALGDGGLKIADVSDPSSPTIIGSYGGRPGSLDDAVGVYASDGLAYVANAYDGVWIVDVSDPTSPTLAGFFDTPYYAEDIVVNNGLIYVADRSGGLFILRYAPPRARAKIPWPLYD